MCLTVLYITNLANHYQLAIGKAFAEVLGSRQFRFAATTAMRADRVSMGWSADRGSLPSWVLCPFEGGAAFAEYVRLWDEADVVICGVMDLDRMERRAAAGRQTFYMGERWLRMGFTGEASKWAPQGLLRLLLGRHAGKTRLLLPNFARRAWRMRRVSLRSSMHLLPMGHYAASDMAFIGAFPSRVWNWGYFADVPVCEPPSRLSSVLPGREVRILWAGRMLDWKRVDTLLRALVLLVGKGYAFRLNLVGQGPELARLKAFVMNSSLNKFVAFEPAIPAQEVRVRMQISDIYVLPSSETEGWGVVINEAMSEGCAVVASREAGASCVLIEHGQNGLLFTSGDVLGLTKTLESLLADSELRARLGDAAWATMTSLWSPQIGAQRLVRLCDGLLGRTPIPVFQTGPCARMR